MSSQVTTVPDTVMEVFKKSTMYFYLLAVLLVVYLVVFIGFGRFLNRDGGQDSIISYIFDFVFLGSIAVYIGYKYKTTSPSAQNVAFDKYYADFLKFYGDDWSLVCVMLFVLCFYLLLFVLRMPLTQFKPFSIMLVECVSWFLLATLVINDCLKYFFNVDIINSLLSSNMKLLINTAYVDASGNPFDVNGNPLDADGNPIYIKITKSPSLTTSPQTSPPPVTTSPKTSLTMIPGYKKDADGNLVDASGNLIDEDGNIIPPIPEVFHIPNNLYKYEDAQAICKVYDSRLATYDELEQSYEDGAEWCNYGWSAEQMAFFPTQKNTWDDLQKTDKHKNKCGRPGVNGGLFPNPEIKFGVNCFGVKPKPTDKDILFMKTQRDRTVPKSEEEIVMDQKVAFWKKHKNDMLKVGSFNMDKWSRY